MFKCYDCGATYDCDEDLSRWTEKHGLDSPPYEHFTGCRCGGTVNEAEECQACHDWFLKDEDITDGWCHECAREAYTDALGWEYINKERNHSCRNEPYDYRKDFAKFHFDDGDYSKTVADILLAEFKKLSDIDIALGRQSWERINLKNFCLEDLDDWIEFLNETGEN